MAKPEILKSIQILSKKIDLLIKENQQLKEKINQLELENQELNRMHSIDASLLAKAEKDLNYLSLSYRLAASPEALILARKEISRLIRTIDNCIRMMKED
ncbi:MAG: hypothetical protein J1F12_07520 [Muribaculaceae bacterium]|nr:hypothetical protein [Muribaculaceae bacterium]